MTRTRRSAAAWVLAALTLLLSGCIRADVDVVLNPDDTAGSTLVIAVEDEFADSTGREAKDVLKDALRGKGDPERGAERTEEYVEGGYTGTRYVYPVGPLASLPETAGLPVTVVRDGDDYVVDATVDLTEDALNIRGVRAEDVLTVTLRVTFPGPVAEADGTVAGTTVTWTPPVGEVSTIHARGSAVDPASVVPSPPPPAAEAGGAPVAGGTSSGVPGWLAPLIAVGGLAILLLLGVVVWQALRVRPPAAPGPGAGVAYPAQYPGAHGQEHPTLQQYPQYPQDPHRPPSFPPGV
ncbi:LppM family (lipo)protein [Antribacter gilvus]|uniref:LppM family (lipo)protein n=1 Tax=Antribacter gilvus TaxID=2304675 RepID=UPI000F785AD3|nr:hypothetical protein [Antribacter gilvus]